MPIICAHREPGTPCAWFIQQWRANGESWGGREEGETGHHEVIQSSRITNTPGQQLIMSFNHGEHPCQATKQRVFNTKRKKKTTTKKKPASDREPRGEARHVNMKSPYLSQQLSFSVGSARLGVCHHLRQLRFGLFGFVPAGFHRRWGLLGSALRSRLE